MEIALKSNMLTYSGGLAPDSLEYTRDRQEIHELTAKYAASS